MQHVSRNPKLPRVSRSHRHIQPKPFPYFLQLAVINKELRNYYTFLMCKTKVFTNCTNP